MNAVLDRRRAAAAAHAARLSEEEKAANEDDYTYPFFGWSEQHGDHPEMFVRFDKQVFSAEELPDPQVAIDAGFPPIDIPAVQIEEEPPE